MTTNIEHYGTTGGTGFVTYHNQTQPTPGRISSYCERAAEDFEVEPIANITDRFFKHIEDHKDLRSEYDELTSVFGQRTLNAQIGRWIREHFNLDNGEVTKATLSGLITAYTTHSHS